MSMKKDMRVHIVDDYSTMLRILRNLLRQINITDVDESNSGDLALERIKASPPDLIISDWNMEPMTGLELLRHVRSDEKLKRIPFIMVTAESKIENVPVQEIMQRKAGRLK